MRRLFGGTPPRPPSADVPHHKQQQQQQQANNHQHNNVTPSKKKHSTGGEGGTRHAFTSLRNSLRRLSSSSKTLTQQQQQRQHVAAEDTNNDEEATRNTNNNMNNGRLLSPSRTFDGRYRSPNRLLCVTDHHHRCVVGGSASPAPSSFACHSEPSTKSDSALTTEGQLDRSLMQTCTDVKYETRRRPKFTAVVDANFQRQCLQAHNYVRQIYVSPALSWSQELAELAKTWALKLADRGRMLYPELPGIGENIFLLAVTEQQRQQQQNQQQQQHTTGDHLTTGTELVAHWAAEARHFDFAKPKWSQNSRHFTQMIWRGSLEMGVARHWNTANDCLAIVAFYRPSGNCNFPGEFAANLPAPDEVPENALEATTLAALTYALNRSDLGDGGFRKGPMPPRIYSCPPNTTKVLKSLDG